MPYTADEFRKVCAEAWERARPRDVSLSADEMTGLLRIAGDYYRLPETASQPIREAFSDAFNPIGGVPSDDDIAAVAGWLQREMGPASQSADIWSLPDGVVPI
jgi:hypothetical protein